MKVEVKAVDAALLTALRSAKANQCMSWDSSIRNGVVIKVEITYPLGSTVPNAVLDAVNECITDCNTAFGNTDNGS
jgi:hypothetical protein